MNLIEAIKTGKPCRRASDVELYGSFFWVDLTVGNKTVALGREDILAEDWEIQTENDDEPKSGAV